MDPRAVSDRQRDHFRALEHTLEPVHTVWSFARELWQQGVPLAVASGSARPAVERTLALLNVRDWFPVVVTPEDVSAGKPAPDMFLLAAEKLAVTPERCLVLEDGEMGFEAARRAGMDYVIVRER